MARANAQTGVKSREALQSKTPAPTAQEPVATVDETDDMPF